MVKPFLSENPCFFPICFNNKSKSCTVFIYLLFFMKSTKNMPLVLRRSKAFKNRFEILQHIKNSTEEFHQPPASLSLNIPRWGVWICVYVRGLICFKSRIHYRGHMHCTLFWTHYRKYFGKKRFKKMEYRTRLLDTVEDFFCQPNFNDSYFQAYIERVFCWSFQSPQYVYF